MYKPFEDIFENIINLGEWIIENIAPLILLIAFICVLGLTFAYTGKFDEEAKKSESFKVYKYTVEYGETIKVRYGLLLNIITVNGKDYLVVDGNTTKIIEIEEE